MAYDLIYGKNDVDYARDSGWADVTALEKWSVLALLFLFVKPVARKLGRMRLDLANIKGP